MQPYLFVTELPESLKDAPKTNLLGENDPYLKEAKKTSPNTLRPGINIQ